MGDNMENEKNEVGCAIYVKEQENIFQKILNKLHLRKPNQYHLLGTTEDFDVKIDKEAMKIRKK